MEKNCTMNEMPRLYGRFKAEFRHADKTLPFLEGSDGKMSADPLLPWSVCGYGTFSGSARYSVELPIAEAGCYLLDLGRVEDLAEVYLNGRSISVLLAPPYIAPIGFLECGNCQLQITVSNGPGNRDRLADLPSGLLGPVVLLKKR